MPIPILFNNFIDKYFSLDSPIPMNIIHMQSGLYTNLSTCISKAIILFYFKNVDMVVWCFFLLRKTYADRIAKFEA